MGWHEGGWGKLKVGVRRIGENGVYGFELDWLLCEYDTRTERESEGEIDHVSKISMSD
jgi:hypothetical protein